MARAGERLSRGRVNGRSVALGRGADGGLVATEALDGPPPERANHLGGLERGERVMPGGAVVRGLWAKAPGVFEAMAEAGLLGPDPDAARRRRDAAEALRKLCAVARLYRSPTGRWSVSPVAAAAPAAESERAAKARNVLGRHARSLGWDRMQLLLDVLVMDQVPVGWRGRPGPALERMLWALDDYAQLLRLPPAKPAHG